MRIIGGRAKGTKLYTLEGQNTRPTLDRVREALFNILQNEIEDAKVQEQDISDNFGKGPMDMRFNGNVQVQRIDTIDAIVDVNVVIELLGIGMLLTLISSLASMISIIKFSPLTILKERS